MLKNWIKVNYVKKEIHRNRDIIIQNIYAYVRVIIIDINKK